MTEQRDDVMWLSWGEERGGEEEREDMREE